MEKIEEQKHFLALMARPGDYVFIDISKLDIANNYNPLSLSEIDAFTMHFSKEEILASITRANLASGYYLSGKLVIQDNQKHNPITVIDKDLYNGLEMDMYLKEKINDKEEVNTLINKFRSLIKNEKTANLYASSLKQGDLITAIELIFNMPYLIMRKYIIYLLERRNLEKNKERKRIPAS